MAFMGQLWYCLNSGGRGGSMLVVPVPEPPSSGTNGLLTWMSAGLAWRSGAITWRG